MEAIGSIWRRREKVHKTHSSILKRLADLARDDADLICYVYLNIGLSDNVPRRSPFQMSFICLRTARVVWVKVLGFSI
jgi:hypothetical protein